MNVVKITTKYLIKTIEKINRLCYARGKSKDQNKNCKLKGKNEIQIALKSQKAHWHFSMSPNLGKPRIADLAGK